MEEKSFGQITDTHGHAPNHAKEIARLARQIFGIAIAYSLPTNYHEPVTILTGRFCAGDRKQQYKPHPYK